MLARGILGLLLAICGVSALTGREPQLGNLRLAVGERVLYQMTFHSTTESRRSGIVEDPQAPATFDLHVMATVAIEPLAAPAGSEESRFRITFEETGSHTVAGSDLTRSDFLQGRNQALQGKSFELTRATDGKLRFGPDLLAALEDPRSVVSLREWLEEVLGYQGVPAGAKPGQKWSSQEAIAEAPFSNMVRRTDSTYLRDGPCRHAGYEGAQARLTRQYSSENCAVVLTRATLARAVNAPADPTAPDYHARGMRTAGQWTGSGETLKYFSLSRGLLVSSASQWEEKLELTVLLEGARFQQSSRVKAEGQIALLATVTKPDVRK